MESYCVIQFKDKQERGKILHFLAIETEAEYKVTADLKKFVAEKFSVKITDYVEMKDQSTDMDQEKEIDKIKTEAVVPLTLNIAAGKKSLPNIAPPLSVVQNQEKGENLPPINTFQNGQSSITQSFSIPDPIVIDQPIPVIDNTQNLMSLEDYGTYVPYLERPVEPKEEIVDTEVADCGNPQNITVMPETSEDTGVEELKEKVIDGMIDNVDNISVDDVLVLNQVDTPSSSITTRSGRVTKTPRYSMDEDSDEEYTPPTKYSKTTDPTEKKDARHKSKCNKCGKEVCSRYSSKMDHVALHTGITKFKCLVDRCRYECSFKGNMVRHMKTKHTDQLDAFTNIELTPDQNAEFDSMMRECFNDSDDKSDDKCQICHQNVCAKREHSLNHIDFVLYKCMEDSCLFESKTMRSMTAHSHRTHPLSTKPKVTRIELTFEQELEIEEMMMKCFPNMDIDGSAT